MAQRPRRPSKIKPLLYLHREDIGIPDTLKSLNPGDKVEVTALVRVLTKSVDPKGTRSMELEFDTLKPSKKGR